MENVGKTRRGKALEVAKLHVVDIREVAHAAIAVQVTASGLTRERCSRIEGKQMITDENHLKRGRKHCLEGPL